MGRSVILLVEDNEDDVFFMRRAFEKAALDNPLHVVMDGRQAMKYLDGCDAYANRAANPFPISSSSI